MRGSAAGDERVQPSCSRPSGCMLMSLASPIHGRYAAGAERGGGVAGRRGGRWDGSGRADGTAGRSTVGRAR